jgi:2Fe-2S ferredoxin
MTWTGTRVPQIIVTTRDGDERRVDAPAGSTAMQAMRDGGINDLLALCGGACSCATCHVYVDSAFVSALPPMSEDENDILDGSSHRQATSRLSCQIPLTAALDGLRVIVAPED